MDLQDLAAEVIAGEDRAGAPFGLYVLASDDPAAELGRHVERTVFLEVFGNTPELLAEEYDPYEASSVFFCVLDHVRRVPAGVMRVILPSPAGVKSLHDIERAWGEDLGTVLARSGDGLDASRFWDVATLAVMPEYRGSSTDGLISLSMYQALAMFSSQGSVPWIVAVLDLVVLDLIQEVISRPFQRFHGLEPMRYLDSPSSIPVFIDVPDYQGRLGLTNPTMYGILFEGTGIEAAVAPPAWELGVHQRRRASSARRRGRGGLAATG